MAINLGNIVSVGDKTVGSGISSGLDSASIIEALTDVKRLPAVRLEETLVDNTAKTDAFSQLRTILDNLQTSSDFIRNKAGFNNESDNIFEYRTASLNINSSGTASDYLSVAADPGANIGSYDVAIGQIATSKQETTGSFTTKTGSITGAASSNAAGLFSAGTFQFGGTKAVAVNVTPLSTDDLASADYTVDGSAVGTVITAAGINNIVSDGTGDTGFIGTISGFSGTFNSAPTSELVATVAINGTTYTSNIISTVGGVDSLSIAAGTTITFTDATSGTSFDLTTGASDYLINDDQANVTQFLSDLDTALASQSVYQTRALSNVDTTKIPASSPLAGLTDSNVVLTSDGFNATTGDHGDLDGFTVTHVGAGNNTISVTIDDEIYQITGQADSLNSNITLSSTTTNKTLDINLADAGITLDLSTTAKATEVQDAFDYAFGVKTLTDITVSEGDSLVDIAAAINAQSTTSGASATIIQVSTNDFRLVLQANDVGLDNSYDIIDYSNVWHGGVGDGSDGVALTSIQAAQDSVVSVNGIVASRSSNSISDIVEDITFNISKVTDTFVDQTAFDALVLPTKITSTISNDVSTVESGIVNFVNAYNDFRIFVSEQALRDDDGNFAEDSALGEDTTLGSIIRQINAEISNSVSGVTDSDFSGLGSIGITLTDFEGDSETPATSNILTYDPTELTSAIANNFDAVRQIFEFSFSASKSNIDIFEHTNDSTLTDYQIDIDTSRAEGNEVRILDSGGTFLFNATITTINGGYRISGDDDTSLEGTVLVYTGDGTDVITIDSSYGVADRLYNIFDNYLEEDGILDTTVANIVADDVRIQDEIDNIDLQVEFYRNVLLAQYTSLEAAITRVNTLLDFLESQADSINNS